MSPSGLQMRRGVEKWSAKDELSQIHLCLSTTLLPLPFFPIKENLMQNHEKESTEYAMAAVQEAAEGSLPKEQSVVEINRCEGGGWENQDYGFLLKRARG